MQNQEPYPGGDDDTSDGNYKKMIKGDIVRKKASMIYPITLKNYDLIYFPMSGGPGYGDPLERKLEAVKKDLDDGIYTDDIVERIYGVVASFDEENEAWIVNEEATKARREQLRREREEKSVPFEEFWEKEKKKITEDQLSEPVKKMISESLELSEGWAKEFREFWDLAEDYQLEVK